MKRRDLTRRKYLGDVMKKVIAITLLSLFLILYSTEINTPTVSGTWTKTGSPYNINCDIEVPDGETLDIEPGVERRAG